MSKLMSLRGAQTVCAALLFLGLAGTVGMALALQYGWHYHPCELCLLERMPYYVGAALMVIGFLTAIAGWRRLTCLLFIIIALLMLYDFGLSIYHVGVERHYWPGPTACASATASALPAQAGDLLSGLANSQVIIPCDIAGGYIFGLSFAEWNVLACLGFAIFAAFAAWFPFRVGR